MSASDFTSPDASLVTDETVTGLHRFNAFVVNPAEQDEYVRNFFDDLFTSEDGLPEDVKKIVRDNILPSYVRASLLAKSSQKLYGISGIVGYAFSALAVGAVAFAILIPQISKWAFAVELALLLTVLVLIVYANKTRAHKNWIEARYLTECLRSLVFLFICGIEPAQTARSETEIGSSAVRWMDEILDQVRAKLPHLEAPNAQACERLVPFIRERWVQKQIQFHKRKNTAARTINHRLEITGFGIFALAIVAAALHLLFSTMQVEGPERLLTFAAIFLPAAGAAVGGIRTHREYSRLASRSANMVLILSTIDRNLAAVVKPQELAGLLRKIEELSLLEVQGWRDLMSFAKLEAAA